jgi:hypothetical protein
MMIRIEPSRGNKVLTVEERIMVLMKPVYRSKVF